MIRLPDHRLILKNCLLRLFKLNIIPNFEGKLKLVLFSNFLLYQLSVKSNEPKKLI